MAVPLLNETELLGASGNQLNYSDMTRLNDGRIVSVGQNVLDVEIRITDPATGAVTVLPDLRGDDLRGAPNNAITGVLHTLHNVAVAPLPDGGFVVAAQLNQNINGSFSQYEQIVYMQRFNGDGSLRGAPFQGAQGQNMRTSAADFDLVAHPEGTVLFTRTSDISARFHDANGNLVATRTVPERAFVPEVIVTENNELLLVWFQRATGTPMFPNQYVPPALVYQPFTLNGTPVSDPIRLENGPGGEFMKLLQLPDGSGKLLYLAGTLPVQGNQFAPGSGGLMMATLDSDANLVGGPVLIMEYDQAPAGDGRWRIEGFDAALDGQGGITVALEVDIIENSGQLDTRQDVFVAGFNLDGSLRSAPVLASTTTAGLQQDPLLATQADGSVYLQFMQFQSPQTSGPTQLMGVTIDPSQIISPTMAVDLALNLPQGITRDNVLVTFTSDDGNTQFTAVATPSGYRFEVSSLQAQGLSGRIEMSKAYTPAAGDPVITANDALEILRMAVGLQPAFGVPVAQNFIAADINGDGVVNATDALEVLRAAVGLTSSAAPRWVFLDVDLDTSQITPTNVSYQTGIAVPDFSALGNMDMTGILLGHMGAQT